LAELVEVWRACLDDDYGRIVRLLILCGQRRTEIGDLAWCEIDLVQRQIDLPGQRTKNARPHVIPLADEALAILGGVECKGDREHVFGSDSSGFGNWSRGKAELDRRISEARYPSEPMPAWTLHDLRRSFVTHLNERKLAPPHIIEAIINHASGHIAGVAGTYNRAKYLAERRQALELWGAFIAPR
jgi:integrase